MTIIDGRARTNAGFALWGWRIVLLTSALLIVNAGWLFFGVGTAAVLEADTGVSASELAAAYPQVVEELAARGRTIALLLAGLAALSLVVAVGAMRTGSSWARRALWAFVTTTGAVAIHALAGGRIDIGSFYLAWAALTAVGLVVAGRAAVGAAD